jgi:hypothetical protein
VPRRTMITMNVAKKAAMTRIPSFHPMRRGIEEAAVGLGEAWSVTIFSFCRSAGGPLVVFPGTAVRRVVESLVVA